MSDQPHGYGWWQASDGKWYPPQPPAPTGVVAAASRVWLIIGVLVLIAVLAFGGAALVNAINAAH